MRLASRRSTRSRPSTPISSGEGGRRRRPAADRPRLRQPDLRACSAARSCWPSCSARSAQDVRVVRAPCVGLCDQAPAAEVGHHFVQHARPCDGVLDAIARRRHASAHPGLRRLRRLRGRRRLPRCSSACVPASSPIDEVLKALDDGRAARPRRRRLPDRPQMALRARRARAAPDGGQCRRGRARHLQGPPLPRHRSAPLPRRDADRRPCGRGGGGLHLPARRVPDRAARSCCARSPSCRRAARRSICAAAPAPTSAARNRRCSRVIEGKRGCRATSRPSRSRSACSAGRR